MSSRTTHLRRVGEGPDQSVYTESGLCGTSRRRPQTEIDLLGSISGISCRIEKTLSLNPRLLPGKSRYIPESPNSEEGFSDESNTVRFFLGGLE